MRTLSNTAIAALLLSTACVGDKDKGDDTAGGDAGDPSATILSPDEGAVVQVGDVISLDGLVSDPQDGPGDLSVAWLYAGEEACAPGAPDADGTTTCELAVPDPASRRGAAVVVELVVVDSSGATDTAAITLDVLSAEAPDVTILAPEDGAVAYADTPLSVSGLASDDQDPADSLVATWASDLDGALDSAAVESDGTVSGEVSLSAGVHVLELMVEDLAGAVGSDAVTVSVFETNTPPSCAITAPGDGTAAQPGEPVGLVFETTDDEDGPGGLVATWSSDRNGTLGSASPGSDGTVDVALEGLSEGVHTLQIEVTDSGGLVCTDSVGFTIGSAPEITLFAPTSDTVFNDGAEVAFVAALADDLDAPDALTIEWSSDIDGVLTTTSPQPDGSAEYTTETLSNGAHVVTLTATDTDGFSNSASVDLTINGLPSAPDISLSPDPLSTSDDLVVSVDADSVDPEGDAVTYAYAWDVDGVVSSETSSTLSSSAFVAGEAVRVTVTPNDGAGDGAPATASITVGNTAPVLASVSLTPDPATEGDTLTCTPGTASDADGDTVVYAYTWTVAGASVSASGDTLDDSHWAKGDAVVCAVVPSDGTDAGASVSSNSVTISNAPPSILSVSISPASPSVSDPLVCEYDGYADPDGDADASTIAWTVNGAAAGSGATLAAGSFAAGDTVVCAVTPDDGTDTGAAVDATVVVGNSAPEIASVGITPSTAVVGETLTCSYTGYSDADGDADQSTYRWTVGSTQVGTSSTLSTGFSGGETLTCTVTPYDGSSTGTALSDSLVIDNTAPVLSTVSLSPTSAAEGDTLTCTPGSTTDADGDSVSYNYAWTVGGSAISATSSTLSDAQWSRDDAVVCTVTPNDGTEDGAAVASNTVTISNSAPSIGAVSVSPTTASVADTLTCSYSGYSDADGDADASAISWTIGGTEVGTSSTLSSGFAAGDTVTCTVTPGDGTDTGSSLSASASISNTPPETTSVAVTPTDATAGDTLSCAATGSDADGDTVTFTYAWSISGSVVGTGASLSSGFGSGDVVVCTATPNDGTTNGTAGDDSVTIGNSTPSISAVSITPSTATVSDTLTCSYSGYSDADGDADQSTYSWTISGTEVGTSSTLSSGFSAGDTVTCAVTPYDGTDAGVAVSDSVDIDNTAPVMTSVVITPSTATVSDLLTCTPAATDADGDSVSYIYSWTVSGTEVGNLSIYGGGAAGDTVTCTVAPDDGTDTGAAMSDSVTIDNTAPVLSSVSLTPASATEGDTLTCTPGSASDADGDTITYGYAWTVAGSDPGVTTSTLSDTYWDRDEAVVCTVTPSDGTDAGTAVASNTVTIDNSAPSVSAVSITPSTASAGDTLTCSYSGYSDADGDADASTYSWTISGTEVGTSSTLSSGFSGGDTVICTVTPYDGDDAGSTVSDSISIDNSAPSISSVSVTPNSPTVSDTLTCSYSGYSDADGDADQSTYSWTIGGTEVGTSSTLSSGYSKGDTVACTVTPYDGVDTGTAVSDSESIENSAPSVSSISVSPSSPVYASTLSVSYTTTDADGDSVSVSYAWFVGGSQVSTASTLSVSSYAVKGDAIYVELTPTDGFDPGSTGTSSTVSVGNTAPTTPTIDATDDPAVSVDDIECEITATSSDVDGDTISYVFEWEADGAVYPDDFGSATGPDTTTYTGDTIPAADTALASAWTCFVYATDGTGDSSEVDDTSTVVSSTEHALDASNFHSGGTAGTYDSCGNVIFNSGCLTDWGFVWTDTGATSPTAVLLEFNMGIQCGTVIGTKTVYLNGVDTGTTFTPDGVCACTVTANPKTLTLSDLSGYVSGGSNTITFDRSEGVVSGACEGVSSAGTGYAGVYGQITVTR